MWFRLALALGRSVAEAQASIDSREFAEWIAYDQIEPIDSRARADLGVGIIASTIANCHRARNARPYRPADFMPQYDMPRRQSAEQQHAIFAAFAEVHNKAVRKRSLSNGNDRTPGRQD